MAIETHSHFTNFHRVTHPLIAEKTSRLRSSETEPKLFRELVNEITCLLLFEATAHMAVNTQSMTSPLMAFEGHEFATPAPIVLPIMRAGISMVDSFLTLLPYAKVAFIGLYRDEDTLAPHRYYLNLPDDAKDREIFICDPMLATGGSANAAILEVKKAGVKKITIICIIAAPEGVSKIFENHPDVSIFSATLDTKLNDKGYIEPGLGDAGDRLYGTEKRPLRHG